MIRTARARVMRGTFWALLLSLCLCAGAACAQGQTTLTVQMRGVVYDLNGGWRAVTLSAPVDVLGADGAALGQVVAGAKEQSGMTDTLDVSGQAAVTLRPAEGTAIAGFAFGQDTDVTLQAGQANLATVFAYAEQGLFRVTGAPAGAELAVLDASGAELLRFAADESGAYQAERLLPSGEYQLVLPNEAEPIPFAVTAYMGNDADIATIAVGSRNATVAATAASASLSGSIPEAGAEVVAASVSGSLTALTDASGAFRFDGLNAGEYSIYAPRAGEKALEAASAWRLTDDGSSYWITVSVAEGEALALPALRYATQTTLEGFAYLDDSGDAARGEDEPLLAGVPLTLQRAEGDGWMDVESIKTNEYGKFRFEGLAAGDYRVTSHTQAAGFYIASVGASVSADISGARLSDVLTLRDGDQLSGVADIRLGRTASLSFTAFVDGDLNGARATGEAGVAHVLVEALDGERVVASGETGADGALLLASVPPGQWALRVTLPAGRTFGARGADSCVGGVTEQTALSEPLTFASGEATATGVGVSVVGSFSGKVFEDENDNGVMDDTDPGAAGVLLRLVGKKTGAAFELTSDESGLYSFNNLPADSYTFTATLPEGMLFARYSKTGGDLRSVFTGSTTARQYAVSDDSPATNKNVGVIERGEVSGVAFLDVNYNGILDEGEPGFEGLTLELIKITTGDSSGRVTTGADGAYRFEGLRGGNYRLRAILPDDGRSEFTVVASGENANLFEQREGRRENSIQPVEVGSGAVARTLVGVATGARIEGVVYQDEDYSGAQNGREKLLSGMKVRLVNERSEVVANDTTNAKGAYALTGVMPGQYTVEVQRRANYGFTRVRPDEDRGNCVLRLVGEYGVTAPIEIAMGQDVGNINAGMLPSATVQGSLFHDANDDGLLSEGETGMAGATVRLRSEDGEIDLTHPIDESGAYFFDGVMPGGYTLTFALPEHTELAAVVAGGNTLEGQGAETTTAPFTVAMGENHQYPLVGAVALGSFEGVAFHDSDASGAMDGGEAPLSGVVVTLSPDRAGLEAQSVKTGADGAFSIVGLRPAGYRLTVALPDGYIASHDLTEAGIALEAANEATADCGWQALVDRKAKLLGAVQPASLTGAIWLDENQNAARSDDEALLKGVTVELVSETTGLVAARTVTTDTGYALGAVRPGAYRLRFELPQQSQPANESGARFIQNGSYMVLSGLTVREGEALGGLDAGLVSTTSIGGSVRLNEYGSVSPVSGVTVSLYRDGEQSPLATAVTAGDGSYRFDGLWPGSYALRSTLPQGTIFVRPSDGNYAPDASFVVTTDAEGGASEPFTLLMAQHQLSRDVMLIKPARIGDQAWLDENRNGLIDADERLLPGVTVRLLADGAVAYETVTDGYGYYLLDDVYPGEYTLEAVAYPELGITQGVSALRLISSCLTSGDGSGARSQPFTVSSGSADMDYNLGFVLRDGQALPALPDAPQKDWTGANTPD